MRIYCALPLSLHRLTFFAAHGLDWMRSHLRRQTQPPTARLHCTLYGVMLEPLQCSTRDGIWSYDTTLIRCFVSAASYRRCTPSEMDMAASFLLFARVFNPDGKVSTECTFSAQPDAPYGPKRKKQPAGFLLVLHEEPGKKWPPFRQHIQYTFSSSMNSSPSFGNWAAEMPRKGTPRRSEYDWSCCSRIPKLPRKIWARQNPDCVSG